MSKAALSGKYAAYPEYKDSGVEWLDYLPLHWKTVSLKMLIDVRDGTHDTPPYVEKSESSFPLVTSKDVTRGKIDLSHCKQISKDDYISIIKRSAVSVGDILMPMIGTVGSPILVKDEANFAIKNLALFKTSNTNNLINKTFLLYFLNSNECSLQFSLESRGGVQNFVSLGTLRNLGLPLVSLDEQTQIAAFLDHETAKIDTLIDKQQQLIKLLKEKRQAVISHAVTKGLNPDAPMKDSGVEWLGEVPEHWVLKPLNMASSKLAVGLATSVTNYYRDSGVRIIRNMNIKEGYFDGSNMLYLDDKFALHEKSKVTRFGDVLIVRTGSNIGLACTTPKEFDQCHTFTTLIVTPNQELYSEFLTYCINSAYGKSEVKKLKQGFGKDNLNVEELRRFQVVVPSYKEQIGIVNYLNEHGQRINRLLLECSNAISLIKERRTALISAAVTGKIDVRYPVSPPTGNAENEHLEPTI